MPDTSQDRPGDTGLAERWPTVSYEDCDWAPGKGDHPRLGDVACPYAAAVLQPVNEASPSLSRRTLALVEEGTNAIVRFDERVANLPVPMPAILLRSESTSSSEVERVPASARDLAMATIGTCDEPGARLVAANIRAMQADLDLPGPLDEHLVLAVHEALLGDTQPDLVGRFRDRQVWIGDGPFSPHRATFVAPHPNRVNAAMSDLVEFSRRTDLPALAHAAIFHAQFETIHPFEDGNGRTGRVLLQSMLRKRDLTRHTTIPISAGLLADTESYFQAFAAYRAGDVAPFVEQVSRAAVVATNNAGILADQVCAIHEAWKRKIPARRDAAAWQLANRLFAQPVINVGWARSASGCSDRTTRNAIDALMAAGVLHPSTKARRNRLWQATDVLTAMDAFTARARRPRFV